MTPNEAKIGVFVRGNNSSRYNYTNSNMTLGVVIENEVENAKDMFRVMILRHNEYPNKKYGQYNVLPEYFDVVDVSETRASGTLSGTSSRITLTDEEKHILDLIFNKSFDIDGKYNVNGHCFVRRYGAIDALAYENHAYYSTNKIMPNLCSVLERVKF